jgi:hypothetical protein
LSLITINVFFPRHTGELYREVQRFLWTKQVDGQMKQKRRLVARKHLSVGLEMGGLGISHPDETIPGFQQNLLQKIFKQGITNPTVNIPSILLGLLDRAGHR